MLYHMHPVVEQFGLVRFRTWKVLELDSGASEASAPLPGLMRVPRAKIERVLSNMAVIIPIRNERVKFLEGVLSGVPRGVEVIVISNSSREPVDRFLVEREAIASFAQATGRRVTLLHQRDPALGQALADAGYGGLLDEEGLVSHGKGQSMAVGVLAALAAGSEFMGFLDSDNFVPGAVMEHVWNYAAGFTQVNTEHVCVRDVWNSKPKVRGEIVFKRGGRVSRVTNKHLNDLLAQHTGFETEHITTGNAGEHAFNAELARKMPLAAGFAVETWELIWMLERWGGVVEVPSDASGSGVDIFQVETRNPHFHEEKGEGHLGDMLAVSLGCIYHSPLANERTKKAILEELEQADFEGEPPAPEVLPAPREGDEKALAAWFAEAEPDLVVGLPVRR